MRKLAIGLTVLALVILGGLIFGPSFIDANRFKGELAERFREQTGRELSLGGPLDLRRVM